MEDNKMIEKLSIGDKIPDKLGVNQDGKIILSSDFVGKNLIIYFYPKDNSSGCTSEATSLRDNFDKLSSLGYCIVGVSADSISSHQKFIKKIDIPFDLIADTDKELINAFGVMGEKKLAGHVYDGIYRTTFLVNKNGIITDIITPKEIKTKTHGNQLLERIEKNDAHK